MCHSMTGYGRCETRSGGILCSAEIRSVNNRYLDFNIRMPRRLNSLESRIREVLSETIFRGKVDVFITFEDEVRRAGALSFHEPLAAAYLETLKKIGEMDGVTPGIRAVEIARMPEVLSLEDTYPEDDEVWPVLENVLREAARSFVKSRAEEGKKLADDIAGKLDELEEATRTVISHEPEIIEAYRARIGEKMKELLADSTVEDSRIAAEAALFADRISTDEESVRLLSHIDKVRGELEKEGSIGRSLDFIVQEMNREANTMLSKAGDLVTADTAIALKTGIEKIREQVQNIE